MTMLDISGTWRCEINGQRADARLPGTLDENGLGRPDDPMGQWKLDEVRRIGFWHEGDPIVTRLTRKHTWTGEARFTRRVDCDLNGGARWFADVERARSLRLRINGREAPLYRPGCLSAPYTFEVTGLLTGRDEWEFLSDNSYPGWPAEAITYSSAASDETQTNWNGLLGTLRLRAEAPVFVDWVRVYPADGKLDAVVELDTACPWQGSLQLSSDALAETHTQTVSTEAGRHSLWFRGMALRQDARLWDLDEGCLHSLTVTGPGLEARTVTFGIRRFAAEAGHLTLNGRRIFLRGETNCAVFPETGYCPMDTDTWLRVLARYREYGVNCVRFHSHCPPEAAFDAADRLGMLMQPELSHWDPEHAFASDEARQYYKTELFRILARLANHPSFVMLSLGNELQADEAGHAFMDRLLADARAYDGTRLYTPGSNAHYGQRGADPAGDFHTAMRYRDRAMRATGGGMSGWLNRAYPDAALTYDAAVAALRAAGDQPVFSFEVGQYEVLPDFGEIGEYRGVLRPDNLSHIRRKVRERGLEKDWRRMAEATGESSLQCYRAEVEAALRTDGYSGISLLGLQDFPGQGTALVGMLNAHLAPKPYDFAKAERFRAFFTDALPLALLPRFTYEAGETLTVPIRMANYGRKDLNGTPEWRLAGDRFRAEGILPEATAARGGLTDLGQLTVPLDGIGRPVRLTLTVAFSGCRNSYDLWVYPPTQPVCPEAVCECRSLDDGALAALERGGCVYLAPDSTPEALPGSVQAQFSPDFWSVCTFPNQSGCMGQLIDASHPLFERFPTERWSTWQWWPMATARAVVLPERVDCIVAEMDSYAFLRPMAQLFECRCGRGRLLFSSMGLHRLQQYPEARALQAAIYAYMTSDRFRPAQALSPDWIRKLTAG